MPASGPNFSPFPFERLRRTTKRAAALESAIARWIAVRPLGARTAELCGGPVRVRLIGAGRVATSPTFDPHAALAEVRIDGLSIVLACASRPIRAIAQRLLGGPDELEAPRPLTTVEQALWSLAIAAAIADTGVAADVWPLAGAPERDVLALELTVELSKVSGGPLSVIAYCPPELVVRAPPPRALPAWRFELPIVLGRAAIPRAQLSRLAVRDVIVVERCCELVIGDGAIGLSASPGAVEVRVATEYVRAEMALPDQAHLELTVQLGTTRMTLRQIGELAVGQIISLGRPLAGPYEIRAAGQLVGQGELIDIDGELGVRIVSLATPVSEAEE